MASEVFETVLTELRVSFAWVFAVVWTTIEFLYKYGKDFEYTSSLFALDFVNQITSLVQSKQSVLKDNADQYLQFEKSRKAEQTYVMKIYSTVRDTTTPYLPNQFKEQLDQFTNAVSDTIADLGQKEVDVSIPPIKSKQNDEPKVEEKETEFENGKLLAPGTKQQPTEKTAPQRVWKPTGILHCTVKRAENLPALDRSGSSDPFVKLKLSNQKAKTKVIKKTTSPEWNAYFKFTVKNVVEEVLNLEVQDWDFARQNELIGQLQFPLKILLDNDGHVDKAFKLDNSKTNQGVIYLSLHFEEADPKK